MIYTFYSYKGGVGRSMALANVGELFYRAGFNVLMIDWDLDAPGLERYFEIDQELALNKKGVLDLIMEYKEVVANKKIDAKEISELPFAQLDESVILDIYPSNNNSKLSLITAGRRGGKYHHSYGKYLRSFDWKDFYENWEGELFFEILRNKFNDFADIVLIDSRTGVTEIGGVCTYQFADAIILFCAPNEQNLSGTKEMAMDFSRPEVEILRGGRKLDLLFVPSRIEDRAEQVALEVFRKRFSEIFSLYWEKEFEFSDASSFWDLKIPYVPFYSFNEKVAIRDQDKDSDDNEDATNDFIEAYKKLGRMMAYLHPLKNITVESLELDPLKKMNLLLRDANEKVAFGNISFAENNYLEALSIARNFESRQIEMDILIRLGRVYLDQKNYNLAEKRLKIALEISKVLNSYSDEATILNYRAEIYIALGDLVYAKSLYVDSLDLNRRIFGDDNPKTNQVKTNLSQLLHRLGEYNEAEKILLEVIDWNKDRYGEDHPSVGLVLSNYAGLLVDLGYLEKALKTYKTVYQIFDSAFGEEDNTTVEIKEIIDNLKEGIASNKRERDSNVQFRKEVSIKNLFISYSRKDQKMMHNIRKQLEKQNFNVWSDVDITPGSSSWKIAIENAIKRSDGIIVLLSPDAKKSQWMEREIRYAESLQKPLYPILISGDSRESIPLSLTLYQFIDLRRNPEYGIENLIEVLKSR